MKFKIWAMALAMTALSTAACAESTIVYGRSGRVDSVIRTSPSGFVVYDGRGRLVRAVRDPHRAGRVFVDERRPYDIVSDGSTLSGGVGQSTFGVGFQ